MSQNLDNPWDLPHHAQHNVFQLSMTYVNVAKSVSKENSNNNFMPINILWSSKLLSCYKAKGSIHFQDC